MFFHICIANKNYFTSDPDKGYCSTSNNRIKNNNLLQINDIYSTEKVSSAAIINSWGYL
jgi:hypothetical protein